MNMITVLNPPAPSVQPFTIEQAAAIVYPPLLNPCNNVTPNERRAIEQLRTRGGWR